MQVNPNCEAKMNIAIKNITRQHEITEKSKLQTYIGKGVMICCKWFLVHN